jgi:hypothetical protein
LAQALKVQRLGNQILADAALAFDQYGTRFADSHPPDEVQDFPHGPRFGDDPPLRRFCLRSDVFDGGDHAFQSAGIVDNLNGPDHDHSLHPVASVETYCSCRHTGRRLQAA